MQNYHNNKYEQYNKYSQSNYSPNYSPKKPVKSFTDLEVYQKALETSVFVAKEIMGALKHHSAEFIPSGAEGLMAGENIKTLKQKNVGAKKQEESAGDLKIYATDLILKNMLPCALSIPHLIAESHSKRFGESTECLKILDEVMLRCNKMVVYLEQTRDILETGVDHDRFDEQIKKYQYVRRKVLNLQRVWRKYILEK